MSTNRTATTFSVIRRLWPEVWRYRWRVGVALLFCGNWMLHTLMAFTAELFAILPELLV